MKLLLAYSLCCALTAGWAQSHHPELPFDHLNIPGTINSSQVNDLIQDHNGLIWIAGNGLYRYDGYAFKAYQTITDSITIAGQKINCLFNDSIANELFVGTHSYGILKRNHYTGKLTRVPTSGGIPIVTHLAQTSDGTVWGSSFSNGVYLIEHDTLRKFTDHTQKFNSNSCIASLGNKLLVGGNRAVYILENKKVTDSIYIDFPNFNSKPLIRITALLADRTGKLWIGTEQFGVFLYDTAAKIFVHHFSPEAPPFHSRINKIFEDKKGGIWILTKGEGLAIYSPSTQEYFHVAENPLSERSLSGNMCTSIIQDRTGIIWIGSTGDLNKYDPFKIKFRHIYKNPFAGVSLHDNMVRGVYEDVNKKLWVGTDGGAVHIFDEKRLAVEKIEIRLAGKNRIAPFYFMDLNKDILLIGTGEGMLQYDRRTKQIGYYPPLKKYTQGHQVRQMVMHNDLLFYNSFGELNSYNFKTKELKVYNKRSDSESNVTTLYIDDINRLWIGVRDGVSLYNPATGQFKRFELEKNTARPLGSYFMVLSLYAFEEKLWIGSFNDGLWTLDLTKLNSAVITNVSQEQEVQNMTVYSTIPDSGGNLWMSTNAGILKYNPQTNQYMDFTVTEGLQQNEFNRLAFTQCSDGSIVYGGVNGINIFNPKHIVIEEDNYTPQFLDITVSNDDTNLQVPAQFDTTLAGSFTYDQNNIDISFFVPVYRNPKRYQAYYKLDGYNHAWLKAETNLFHYANLKPGDYRFQVKTVSVSGQEKIVSLKFNIQYPFWQTWWFIALVVAAIGLLVVAIIQGSLYKSKRDKEKLEHLLRLRTREIEKSHEELESLNQKKDLIFSILSHDLRSPLTTLKGFLSILIDDHQLTQADIKKHAAHIRNSVSSSLDLIDNTLFWSLSQTGNIAYTPTTFSLNDMLQKVGNLYQLVVEKKRIVFSLACETTIMLYADENMAYVTLRNIVSNALKFTPPGNTVTVHAFIQNNKGVISVEDTGIGMSEIYLKKLFSEEQLPLTKGTNDERGTGIGLILCRKFVLLNKGTLHVKSVENKGSQFTIELPLA